MNATVGQRTSTPGAEVLCDGVLALYAAARQSLPVVGVGLLQHHADGGATLTLADFLGTSGHHLDGAGVSDLFSPGMGVRQVGREDLESRRAFATESRLTMSGLAEEARLALAPRQIRLLPIDGPLSPATMIIGLSTTDELAADQERAISRLAADAAALSLTESPEQELSRLRGLAAVEQVMPALTHVLDIREIFDRLSALTVAALPHDFLSAAMFSEDRLRVHLYAHTEGWAFPEGGEVGYPPVLVDTFSYHLIDDVVNHPIDKELGGGEFGARSSVRVAVRLNGRTRAALNFSAREPGKYRSIDIAIARRVADYVALALSHQQLADESRMAAALAERTANLEMLDGLLGALTGVLDITEVFSRVSEIASKVLPHDAMGLPLLTDDRQHVITLATAGMQAGAVPRIQPLPDNVRHLLTEAWDSQIFDDLQAIEEGRRSPVGRLGYRAMLRVPIRLEGEMVGLLGFFSNTVGFYTHADTLIAKRIADHVALVISHQRLADEARRNEELRARASNLDMLDALLAAVTDTGDLKTVIDKVSDIAQKVLPHDAMVLPVLLKDKARVRFHVTTAPDVAKFPEVMQIPEHLRNSDWDHDLVDDLQADPVHSRFEPAKLGYRSALRVPIRVEGQLAAGVGFFSFTPARYTRDDISVARRVADRLALSLMRERGVAEAKRVDELSEHASRLESRVQALTDELNSRSGFQRILGRSASWKQVLTQATQVASTETTVLLLGESGTGKEVVARFLHRASTRKNGPFVALNCAALPEQLLESELFGYERGAFTGAMVSRAGKIEQAAGGVLFLDEVGEMSPAVQAKFLRVLQEREFQRLGGSKTLKSDARVIAATNRNPKEAMERGAFREDLYYRLSVFEISLPPLRERPEDILLLVDGFLAEIAKSIGRPAAGISEDARDRLLAYRWPGNVRELRNAVERAVILCEGGLITSDHLPNTIVQAARSTPADARAIESSAALPAGGVRLGDVERDLLMKALESAKQNKSKAAKLLGVPRGQFYSLLRRHGLTDAKR
jgi:transcriptional regulator with GAF, ATPase, and Fis domain